MNMDSKVEPKDFLSPLILDDERCARLAVELSKTFRELALHSHNQFLPTPINILPTGFETGRYLAIDVGGSNLRVGFIDLLGASSQDNIHRSYEKSWPIEEHLKKDHPEELFSWIGGCIAEVISNCLRDLGQDKIPSNEVIPLGVTFSFPMKQNSISEATLMPMGKGFKVTTDLNLGDMLLAGYSKHRDKTISPRNGLSKNFSSSQPLPEIKIAAITNDAVATLATLAYASGSSPDSRSAVGLIVGTGTNAAISMELKDLHPDKRNSVNLPPGTNAVCVNTEYSINGVAPPLRDLNIITEWDDEVNKWCDAPGFQPLEYLTAGRYLGELARVIMKDYLIKEEEIDPEHLPSGIRYRNGLPTMFISNHAGRAATAEELRPILQQKLPFAKGTGLDWDRDCVEMLMAVAQIVQQRSAMLIASTIIGLLVSNGELKWSDRISAGTQYADLKPPVEELIVAHAGGVISSFPNYFDTFQEKLNQLVANTTDLNRVKRVVLRKANVGGLIGAGVLAGTAWNHNAG